MKVAIFSDTFLPEVNGVAHTLGRWVHYLEAHGVQCKVFAPKSKGQDTFGKEVVERFHSIPFLLYPECRVAVPRSFYINQRLKDFEPDLIHVATPFNLGLYGRHFARKHRIPLVASHHTNFEQYLPHYKLSWAKPLLQHYLYWFHQYCQKTYVPSFSTLEHLSKQGYKNLEIWGRGIDTNAFTPVCDRDRVLSRYDINPSGFTLLYVGRLSPEKGIDILLSTYESLPSRVRNKSHLILVGEGPLYKELQQRFNQQRYSTGSPAVTCLGFKHGKELSEIYAAADLFLFPSATETFGNVVLEAMASGTTVIGAAAGGVKELIKHNKTGVLCRPGSISDYTEAVVNLYDYGPYRHRLERAARQYSISQSWENIFSQLLSSYKEVAGNAQHPLVTYQEVKQKLDF